jgi:4'-phosphopantetheinyl transferase
MESGSTGSVQLVYASPYCDVWMCDLTQAPSAEELASLSPDEIARADRFLHRRHKSSYLSAHVALRRLVSSRAGVSAERLVFLKQPFGKPFLSDPAACFFNLSHSDDLALVAISSQFQVGVDIETVRELDEVHDLAGQHFTPTELDTWSKLAPNELAAAFCQIWVRKEACVKAIGLGLQVPLSEIEVGLGPLEKVVSISISEGNYPLPTEVKVRSIATMGGSFGAVAWVTR